MRGHTRMKCREVASSRHSPRLVGRHTCRVPPLRPARRSDTQRSPSHPQKKKMAAPSPTTPKRQIDDEWRLLGSCCWLNARQSSLIMSPS